MIHRDSVLYAVVIAACMGVVGCFSWILIDIFRGGFGHLNWSFLVDEPSLAGRAGGIAPMIVATGWILFIALGVALPIGFGIALWQTEFARVYPAWVSRFVKLTLDVLAAVPSVVYGLFGYAFFCDFLGFGYSLLAGGLTLACMVIPYFASVVSANLSASPIEWRQGALALGLRRVRYIRSVLIPHTLPGLVAGFSLSLGRATAETAALLFTSGYVDRMPESVFDSGRAVSVHIYELAMNVTGGNSAAYGSAVVLVVFIVGINLGAQKILQWQSGTGVRAP